MIFDFGKAPTFVAATWPWEKIIIVGMPRTPYLVGTCGFSSIFSLAMVIFSESSVESSSNAGATSQATSAPPPPPGPERPKATVTSIETPPSPEDRLLAAVCYPLWPLALLMLFIRSHKTAFVRFHVVQALGVNALGVLVYMAYNFASGLPVIGWQSALFLPFMMPAWFFLDLYLAVRTYGGHSPRVPIAADYAEKYAA